MKFIIVSRLSPSDMALSLVDPSGTRKLPMAIDVDGGPRTVYVSLRTLEMEDGSGGHYCFIGALL